MRFPESRYFQLPQMVSDRSGMSVAKALSIAVGNSDAGVRSYPISQVSFAGLPRGSRLPGGNRACRRT